MCMNRGETLERSQDPFKPPKTWVGEECFLCRQKIKENDEVRFYSGPFIMHHACIMKIFDEH